MVNASYHEHDNPMVSNGGDDDFGYNDGESFENSPFHCDWVDNRESSSNESHDTEERIAYWEAQKSLLQEILEHHSSTGAKLRDEIKRITDTARETKFCKCLKPKWDGGSCYKCLRQRVVNLLSVKGHNATLRISQWKPTSKYIGGTHEFIEVIASTQSRKKQVPFLIELEFRDQFKMAKACEEYDNLVNQLPEIYIGKPEHLNSIVGVVCDAAKKSTEEKRIHMGPWRKRSFMQKKWSVSSSRVLNETLSSPSSIELSLAFPIRQVDMPRVGSHLRFSSAAVVKVA
ncbi:hypothetical protein Vadar_000334 [Vaccinium darrowii]|uniref:Uncharacterized protein n=1 Tax=Vaccinium darrowii TaxID=229202 RepID=A0ACB7WW59_9ERIC|nr:hypothetical protein Vadar_000334 [Vaccinium darrowii]